MKPVLRILGFLRPYWLFTITAVMLLALVGALDAFRLILIKPIFDKVLSPFSTGREVVLFTVPRTNYPVLLNTFVPHQLHNAWTMVAFALVASTLVKSLCDYLGTYLINYAGVRDDYGPAERFVRRGAAAFDCIFSEAHDGDAAVYVD